MQCLLDMMGLLCSRVHSSCAGLHKITPVNISEWSGDRQVSHRQLRSYWQLMTAGGDFSLMVRLLVGRTSMHPPTHLATHPPMQSSVHRFTSPVLGFPVHTIWLIVWVLGIELMPSSMPCNHLWQSHLPSHIALT